MNAEPITNKINNKKINLLHMQEIHIQRENYQIVNQEWLWITKET